MTDEQSRDLEHAWRHFALHAEQRMAVFNFYVASAGLTLTGLAWTLANGSNLWFLGAAAGLAAAGLSLVFWRLDQRGAQLVKVGEDAIAALESDFARNTNPAMRVVTAERALATNGAWLSPKSSWTFGRSFRLLFKAVALTGVLGAILTSAIGITSNIRAKSERTAASVRETEACAPKKTPSAVPRLLPNAAAR